MIQGGEYSPSFLHLLGVNVILLQLIIILIIISKLSSLVRYLNQMRIHVQSHKHLEHIWLLT